MESATSFEDSDEECPSPLSKDKSKENKSDYES